MDLQVRIMFLPTNLPRVLVLLIGWINLVTGQDLCGFFNHRSAIVQNTLYFFGGNYTTSDDLVTSRSTLFSINLETGLDISGPIAPDRLGQSSLPTEQLDNVADGPEMFYDGTGLYAYVASPQEATNNNVWFYNISSGNWNLENVGGDSNIPDDLLAGQAASLGNGMSYYLGGDNGPESETGALGLTIFDSRDPSSLVWDFNIGTSNNRPPGIQAGELVYLRKGEAGILLAFGGMNTSVTAGSFFPPRQLSDISIYDIASQTWYLQEATGVDGSTPDYIRNFCAGVSAAPDDSSFQITIYGGDDPQSLNATNAIWILSIPSFEWVFVGPTGTGEPDGDNAYIGRQRPKCDMLNDRQMIVSGGRVLDNRANQEDEGTGPSWANQVCDPGYPPIKLLDTTDMTWRTQIDSNTEYSVPSIVYNQIGGDGSGGATVTQPRNGWSDSRLEDIFSQTVPRESQESPGSSGFPGNPSLSDSDSVATRTPVGAIVGGTIGGVAFIVLLCAAVYFYRRRGKRHTAAKAQEAHLPVGTETPTDMPKSGYQNNTSVNPHGMTEFYGSSQNKMSELRGDFRAVEIDGTRHQPSPMAELPTERQ